MPRKLNYSCHVAPRYTSGSPALVDDRTAGHVATQERDMARRLNEGVYGDEFKSIYREKGVRGIVYLTWERKGAMWVQDVLSNELFRVPLKEWNGPGWINWHAKSPDEMLKYLYDKADAESLMRPLLTNET